MTTKLRAASFQDGAVTTAKIAADAITNAKIADGAVDSDAIGSSAIVANKLGIGQIGGRRNIVINGAMQVAQRGTSETGAGAAEKFVCDRFKLAGSSSGRLTMTQTADGPVGFANCLKLDCTTADTSIAADEYLTVGQAFEGQDLQAIGKGVTGAKEFTVSFYVKASAAFTFGFELYDADNARHNCRLFNTTTDWVRHSFVIQADVDDGSSPFDDDNAASLYFQFWLHGGSNFTSGTLATDWANYTAANRAAGIDSFYSSTNNNFFVTGIQIEVGSQATAFEHRSFGEELALCQRYYQVITDGNGSAFQASQAGMSLEFRQMMRANPALSLSGAVSITNGYAWDKTQSTVSIAIIASRVTTSGVQVALDYFSGLTQYQPIHINNSGGNILVDAEL